MGLELKWARTRRVKRQALLSPLIVLHLNTLGRASLPHDSMQEELAEKAYVWSAVFRDAFLYHRPFPLDEVGRIYATECAFR